MSSDDSDEKTSKRKERLEQNRLSARESRKRKKVMIEELQRTLLTLSRENKELNEQNEQLRRQLMDMASKYPNVIPIQSLLAITSDPISANSSLNDPSQEGMNSVNTAPPMLVPPMTFPSNSLNDLNFSNMQPTDAALLANLLFRMSGAPLSSAQLFMTPTVQRAATTAAVAATLSVGASDNSSTSAVDCVAETENNNTLTSETEHAEYVD